MHRAYATLFDSRFLTSGLTLYDSLVRHSSVPFRLYVLPLDDEDCARTLEALQLPHVIVLDYRAFEHDQRLADIKKQRTRQEFAWTSASNVCEWLLLCEDCEMDEITYLDADMMFFSDPEQVFQEIGARSIAVIPHRFKGGKILANGKFNVSWVTFRGETGKRCLSRWADQCREWCFYRIEPGRFGDQKYLDEWPALYGGALCEIQNPGAGLAPWNVSQYAITQGPLVDGRPVVFYHFHEYRDAATLTSYQLRNEDREFIYGPYVQRRIEARTRIRRASE